jgi:hypothetical protein
LQQVFVTLFSKIKHLLDEGAQPGESERKKERGESERKGEPGEKEWKAD